MDHSPIWLPISQSKMRILVTGANGLLGQKLVSLISESEGESCIATGRGVNRNPNGRYQYVQLDVTSIGDVNAIIETHRPDVVIHTAAMTQVDECETNHNACWEQNVTAVENLVNSIEKFGGFLLHLSTDFIFDGTSGPYTEDDEPNPLSFYAESKLAAENVLHHSNIKWAIARTMLVYGIAHDMSRSNIILWVKKSLEDQKKIRVVNDQWRMPTLAEDLAKGCLLISRKKATGIFNISGRDMLTPYDMAIATAEFFKLDKSLIEEVDGSIFKQPAKRPPKTGFVLDKAINQLGYQPHSFYEGLQMLEKQLIRTQ